MVEYYGGPLKKDPRKAWLFFVWGVKSYLFFYNIFCEVTLVKRMETESDARPWLEIQLFKLPGRLHHCLLL